MILLESRDPFNDFAFESESRVSTLIETLISLKIRTLFHNIEFDLLIKLLFVARASECYLHRDFGSGAIERLSRSAVNQYLKYQLEVTSDHRSIVHKFAMEWLKKGSFTQDFDMIYLYDGRVHFSRPPKPWNPKLIETLILVDRLDVFKRFDCQPLSKQATQMLFKRFDANRAIYVTKILPKFNLIELAHLELPVVKDLITSYPQLFSPPGGLTLETLKNLSETVWQIMGLPEELQAYYLGFPIHLGNPGSEILAKHLFQLSCDGVEAYADKMCKLGDQVVRLSQYSSLDEPLDDTTPITSLCMSFGPFDRFQFVEDGMIFEIDRPAWESTLDSGFNLITRKSLSRAVTQSLRSRLQIVSMYKLPKAQPLNQLLS